MREFTSPVVAWVLPLLMVLLLLPAAPQAARADDEAAAPPLEMRMFHVGALTAGKWQYLGPQPPPVGPHMVADEESPLFGAVGEEPIYPVGQIDELIELIQGAVHPIGWETIEGASVRSFGEQVLVVQAPRDMQEGVARYLAEAERRFLRTARIEVQAFALGEDGTMPSDAAGWAALPEGPGVSFVAYDGQRASAFAGRQVAYVGDYDVSVAQESDASDPIVLVANLGLIADARPSLGVDDGKALVLVMATLSDLDAMRRVGTGERRPVDAPTFTQMVVRTTVEAREGEWTPLGARQGEWVLCLRVTTGQPQAAVGQGLTVAVPDSPGRPMALRMLDVSDLCTPLISFRTWPTHLTPSNYTPPEPPELPEPNSLFPAESLVELLLEASGNGAWMDPATMEARNGQLIVRNGEPTLDGIERLLETLRADALRAVTTTAEVIDMPAALSDRLLGQGEGGFALDEAAHEALATALASGEAHRLGSMATINSSGVGSSVRAGRDVGYLQDFETEIAQGADASNPVFQHFFAGLQMEVWTHRLSGGRAVALEVQFQQTETAAAMRTLETPAGQLELPELDMLHVRSGLVVAIGGTVLFAARGDGDRRRAVLLTVSPRSRR